MFQNLSRQYASQLLFEVKYSSIYQNIIVIYVLLILFSIFLVSYDYSLFSAILLVVLSVFVTDSMSNNTYRELHWRTDGSWLIMKNKQKFEARLLAGSVVTPYFTSLNFRLENNKKYNVILFKDSINSEKFRQLRVRMKVEGLQKKQHDILAQ